MTSGRSAAGYFAHTLMALVFGSLGATAVIFGQDVEGTFWPIVGETKPTDGIFRDDTKACFTLHLTKLRWAIQPRYEFYAEALLSPRMPIAIYPSDKHHSKFGQDLTTHPVGDRWDRVFCFEMPKTIADNQAVTLYGHGEHDRHRGWRSLSYLKPIRVCGLVPDDPPVDLPSKPDPYCDKQRLGFESATTTAP